MSKITTLASELMSLITDRLGEIEDMAENLENSGEAPGRRRRSGSQP